MPDSPPTPADPGPPARRHRNTILALAAFAFGALAYRAWRAPDPPRLADWPAAWSALAPFLAERARDGDALLVPTAPGETLPGEALPLPGEGRLALVPLRLVGTPDRRDAALRGSLTPLLARHPRLWIIDPPADAAAWLDRQAVPVLLREGGRNAPRLAAYERRPALDGEDAPPRRRTVSLGGMDLLGWDIRPPEPEPAGPGPRLRLVWQVMRRGLPDTALRVSLQGPDGRVHGGAEQSPFRALRPSGGWPFGELVLEPIDLALDPGAPPGRYHLRLETRGPGAFDRWSAPVAVGDFFVAGAPVDGATEEEES